MSTQKIGIITHYHNSQNYGGLLQAYALCKCINEKGGCAEQIQYTHLPPNIESSKFEKITMRLANGLKARYTRLFNKAFIAQLNDRAMVMKTFRERIPHSSQVYTADTVNQCEELYDAFITGSDQVWNTDWYDKNWFLSFVKKKPKYSYAASIGKKELSSDEKAIFQEQLENYASISVREIDAIQLLQPLVSQSVRCDIDPTLLLTKNEWDEVCSERLFNFPYLFCYFLGEGDIERRLAKEYAAKHDLKVVTLPNLNGQYRKCDKKFGDIKKYDVSPMDFISLIKYADFIFTDSFHASVFSSIYGKNFAAFGRGQGQMNGRLETLAKLFNNERHLCANEDRKNIQYIDSLESDGIETDCFIEKRMESIGYLVSILKG